MSTQTATRSALHQAALDFAAAGYKVFPCVAGGKEPACGRGYKDATDDPAQINAWWQACPDYNVAMSPEDQGLAVIDAEHDADLDALELELGVSPDTYVVRTPRGGRHFYYEGSLPSTVRKLAPQVDTRGRGGYVLLPPSYVKDDAKGIDGAYTVENQQPCAPLPPSIEAKLAAAEQSLSAATDDADLPANIERARRYLQDCVKRGDVAIEGKGGNNRTYQAAAWVRDLGISTDTALELIRDEWNPHCVPPWEVDDLAGIVAHAYEYGQNEPGAYASAGTSQEVFAPAIERLRELARNAGATLAYDTLSPFLMRVSDILALPDPEPLVEGFIMSGENACLYGQPKVGKTFIALDVALSVAANLPVFGQLPVRRAGPVVYLSGEGHGGMKRRIMAWAQVRGISDIEALPFYYKADVPNTAAGVDECLHYIDGIRAVLGCDPALVIIDTMARSMAGLNENDAGEVGLYLKMTETLRSSLKSPILTLAHSGKDEGRGIRGSNASQAGFDAVWVAEMNDANRAVKLESKWLKDSEDLGPYCFRLKPVQVAGMAHGNGAVLEWVSIAEYCQTQTLDERKEARKRVADALLKFGKIGIEHSVTTREFAELLAGPPPRDMSSSEYQAWETLAAKEEEQLDNGSRERRGGGKGHTPPRYSGYFERGTRGGSRMLRKLWFMPATDASENFVT